MKYNGNVGSLNYFLYIIFLKIVNIILRKKQRELPKEIKKILVIKPDHIGDTIISTVSFKPLKENYSNCKIDILCGSWGKKTYEYQDKINKIYTLDHIFLNRKNIGKIKKITIFLKEYYKNYILLKKEKYDLCILLRADIRGNLGIFARFINPKFIIGYQGSGLENILDLEGGYTAEIKEKENILNLLKNIPNFKLKNNEYKYEIILPKYKEIEDKIKEELDKSKINILFNFEGNNEERKIIEENVIKILKILTNEKRKKIYLISPPNCEKKIENIKQMILKENLNNIVVINEINDFFHIGYILKNMDIVISVDTSIIHLASIFVEKIIGIFYEYPIIKNQFLPDGKENIVVRSKGKNLNNINYAELELAIYKLIEEYKKV